MSDYQTLDTRLIHAGTPRPRIAGAVVTPVFQTANFEMASEGAYEDLRYARLSNSPSHRTLQARLAAVEGAEAALVSASGMAAVSASLLSTLSAGDHLLVQANVYGGTATLLAEDLPRFGIGHAAIDPAAPDTWAAACTEATRAVFVEAVSNPLMQVPDLPAVVAFARERGLVAIIDNTFLSPVNFRPLEHGFDLVVHSATKYLNGHSDLVAGVVAGSTERVRAARRLQNHLGGSLDPHACFLLERGLKTLGVRVRRQNATAQRVAQFLAGHPAVERVAYPGLSDDPGHAVAARLFDGFGGMLAFETATAAAAEAFAQRVAIPVNAPSLGGVETLVVRPARSSHLGMDPAERRALGITDRLVRISVGLEDPDELIADLDRALAGST